MTDLEINIAIAEACFPGWKEAEFYEDGAVRLYKAGKMYFSALAEDMGTPCGIPNYCHDLNAMHEAEASQLWPDAAFWNRYSLELGGLCNSLAPALHATARQRAEAFLRTIGKWKA